ncbi:MAG: pyrimidine/purine nucleoside phosphorylase [Gammaproteobacteria bacterium]|nr:pyrimidine/purine nucleoside phosphorylase [Gammaproteobacteria bacterium]
MSFKNVEVRKKANVYHGGNVTSRTVITTDGKRLTLGVMLPGAYSFNTDEPEVIELTQGKCRIKIGDAGKWSDHSAGQNFSIPAKTRFDIEVTDLVDYVCHFG